MGLPLTLGWRRPQHGIEWPYGGNNGIVAVGVAGLLAAAALALLAFLADELLMVLDRLFRGLERPSMSRVHPSCLRYQ